MAERHYTGGFDAGHGSEYSKEQPEEKETKADPRLEDRIAFSKKHGIPELAQGIYQEVTGVTVPMPTNVRQKLTNHLEDMFGDTEADEEVLDELIREETERYIKMFAR